MKKNSRINSFRIETETYNKIQKVLGQINEKEELSLSAYCRHALRSFTNQVLSEGLSINFVVQRDTFA